MSLKKANAKFFKKNNSIWGYTSKNLKKYKWRKEKEKNNVES